MSRSNLDGISKLNTAPQLTETITIDRNSREHTQNKVNQKELNKKHLKTKKKSVKSDVIEFLPKKDLNRSFVCLYCV